MASFLTLLDNGTFPQVFNGNPEQLKDAILGAISAQFNTTSFITGRIGGVAPTSNIGVWLNGRTWYSYIGGTSYAPTVMQVGSATFQITLSATPTANRTVAFQDKDGTIALRSDIYVPRDTLDIPANDIDWRLTNSFYKSISANTNITFTTGSTKPGQEIWFVVNATDASAAPAFPAYVLWIGGGTQPVQTQPGVDLWIFRNIGGSIYGERKANYV